jgi:hypothetical protein
VTASVSYVKRQRRSQGLACLPFRSNRDKTEHWWRIGRETDLVNDLIFRAQGSEFCLPRLDSLLLPWQRSL